MYVAARKTPITRVATVGHAVGDQEAAATNRCSRSGLPPHLCGKAAEHMFAVFGGGGGLWSALFVHFLHLAQCLIVKLKKGEKAEGLRCVFSWNPTRAAWGVYGVVAIKAE